MYAQRAVFTGSGPPTSSSPPIDSGVLDELRRRSSRSGRRRPTRPACARGRGSRAAAPRAPRPRRAAAREARRARPSPPGSASARPARAAGTARTARAPRAPLEQPVAQEPRRDAVLAVVLVDLAQERVVARLHPLLEDDDRGAAVLHLGLPLEVEEGLQLLQPVARPRGADAVADDAVEVDEDARGGAGRRARARACRSGPSAA